jgi:hypothetical protein
MSLILDQKGRGTGLSFVHLSETSHIFHASHFQSPPPGCFLPPDRLKIRLSYLPRKDFHHFLNFGTMLSDNGTNFISVDRKKILISFSNEFLCD